MFTNPETDSESFELFADGNRRHRLTILTGEGAGYYEVWDGKTLLMYNPQDDPKYQRNVNPSKDEYPMTTFFYRPDTAEFQQLCPAAKRLGTKTLFGRRAVRYHCDKVQSSSQWPDMNAREMALDDKTGLVLDYGTQEEAITDVTFAPVIKADTFSTELPPGVNPSVLTPQPEPTDVPPDPELTDSPPGGGGLGPYELGSFRLRAVGGGFISGTTYRGEPYVIVAGPADGIRAALRRLLPMTRAAKLPVVGLLLVVPPKDWKGSLLNRDDLDQLANSASKSAGKFAVPVGLDFKGAAMSEMFMGAVPDPPDLARVTIALVASDGSSPLVASAQEVTDATLRTSIAALS